MPKLTPFDELCKAFKLKKQEDETFEDFAARASTKVNNCTDAQWKELTHELQVWCNATLEAREKSEAIPDLEGWPEEAVDPETGEVSEDADASGASETDGDPDESGETGEETVAEGDNSEQDAGSSEKAPVARKKLKSAPKVAAKTSPKKPQTGKAKAMSAKSVSPKPAKKAAAGKGNGKISDDDKIKLLVEENPHRQGSGRYKRWSKYKDGMTVAAAIKAGLNLGNIHHSVEDGHIKIVKSA